MRTIYRGVSLFRGVLIRSISILGLSVFLLDFWVFCFLCRNIWRGYAFYLIYDDVEGTLTCWVFDAGQNLEIQIFTFRQGVRKFQGNCGQSQVFHQGSAQQKCDRCSHRIVRICSDKKRKPIENANSRDSVERWCG